MKARAPLALFLSVLMAAFTGFSLHAAATDEELPALPITYDSLAALSEAAGEYAIGGSGFVKDAVGEADFSGPYAVLAQKSETKIETEKLSSVVVVDTEYNNRVRFKGTQERAWIDIFEYTKGDETSRALWWTCGESWYNMIPILQFTAPESGTYDIGANEYFPNIGMTDSAIRDCAQEYKDSKVTFQVLKNGKEVLSSCTFSVNDPEKEFPAVEDVELMAGETIVFRATVEQAFVDACWYGTNFEAVPSITLTERLQGNVAPVLSADQSEASTLVGEAVTLAFTASDGNGDALTVTAKTEAQHGEVAIDAQAGTVTYTPDEGFAGDDSFALVANDGALDSNELLFSVSVYKSISDAIEAIKENVAYFYEEPQGSDWLDMDQSLCAWQWQVYYDGLLGLNEQGWRLAEMAIWDQWGITLAHTDAPAMNITETDQLLLNCDKPFGLNAKGALTFVAPEDGLYRLTCSDALTTLGLDKWFTPSGEGPESDRYTTPVYVSITKDNKIVWPENGEPLKLDPTNAEALTVDFPTIETAMKQGDSLRIVVQMDENCKSWMNRVLCAPVVYGIGDYDESKDLNPSQEEPTTPGGTDDTQATAPSNTTGSTEETETSTTLPTEESSPSDDDDTIPDTGHAIPAAAMLLGAGALIAAIWLHKSRKSAS